ncbi:MAG: tetratricopeptide repeat protein [Lamprocystis purpurea]|nr:tetratricopeptide repeat protein [Lamprocystis purpurea]
MALERYRALDNPRGVAAALGVIADGLETQDRIGEALRIRTEEQIPVLLRLGDKQAEGKALNKLGKTYAALGEFEKAAGCHEQALMIARADGDHLGEADTLLAIGRLALRTDDHNAARDAYQQALSLYRADNVHLGEANTLKAIGDLALRTADLTAARDAYRQALPLFRALKDRRGEANTLQAVGDLAQRTDDHPAARDAYQQALSLQLELINTMEGYAATAFRSFVELWATFQSIGDHLGIQSAFAYMARAAEALGQIDRTLLLAGESLALGRAANDRFGQSITLKLMVRLLQDAGDAAGWPAALVLYRELLAGVGDMRTLAQTDALWQQVAQQVPAAELERLRTQAPALLETALAAARERFGGGDPTRLD